VAEKKRQHFVPRMILRKFSSDGRSVRVFPLDGTRHIPVGSIAHQCSEDYFYGRDLAVENAFEQDERQVGRILSDLAPTKLAVISEADIILLKSFIYFQRARTRRALDEADAYEDAAIKLHLQTHNLAKGADLSLVSIKRTGGAAVRVGESILGFGTFADLELRFLVSETGGFVLADHPVVFCNYFVEHDRHLRDLPGATGLVAKGLQIFMPVSPNVTVALFDPNTYAYGANGQRVCSVTVADVELLNRMQAVNADNALYFAAEVLQEALDRLAEFRRRNPLGRTPEVKDGPPRSIIDGHFAPMVALDQPRVRVRRRPSFVTVTETFDYSNYAAYEVPVRDFELLEFAQKYAQDRIAERKELARKEGLQLDPVWDHLFDEDNE
jgi:hypothetical protein